MTNPGIRARPLTSFLVPEVGIICRNLLIVSIAILAPSLAHAQWPYASSTSPDAQRNALNALRSQMSFFQNATRTASSYGQQGYGNVQGQFQGVRDAYNALKQTLTPQQSANGANAIAELDAGLDILQEAFTNFQNDLAAGRQASMALRDMCEVLRQGSQLWSQQLTKTCSQLRVGWG
jgi:hypothetical protein